MHPTPAKDDISAAGIIAKCTAAPRPCHQWPRRLFIETRYVNCGIGGRGLPSPDTFTDEPGFFQLGGERKFRCQYWK
jgi:hypothetical protein